MRFPRLFKPGDQVTSSHMNRMAILTITFGIMMFGLLMWSSILTWQLKETRSEMNETIRLQGVAFTERMNEMELAHHQELARVDVQLEDAVHNIEVLQSQLEIVDSAINGRDKRKARMLKVIAAIKDTVPEFREKLAGCDKSPSPGELWSIAGAIVDNADEYAVPASLITAVIKQESAFCNNAVSPVGAKGYMQLMPETAAEVSADVAVKTGRALRTWRGRDNIQLGTAYLSAMLLEFDGDVQLAAAAYNAGPTHVKKVLAGLTEEHECSRTGSKSPYYCETADYMVKVSKYKEEYDKLGIN